MGRESREIWEKRVARWRDSGLSAREFAGEVGIKAGTLGWWASRLRQAEPGEAGSGRSRHRRAHGEQAATTAATTAPVKWLEVVGVDGHSVPGAGAAPPPPMFELVIAGRTIRATGVLVQAKEKCRVGHFWVLVAPGKHVLYRYSARHDGAAVDALLAGYEGYLVADAHAVYDQLFVNGKVVEVACWAHARRYWFKALDSEPERARVALGLIGELFRIERAAGDLPARERLALRGRESWPVVEKFFAWCKAEAPRALDDTPIARAIGYALNQRTALERFLEDGRLPLHNNGSEQALRREVIGRKNWLFVGNDDAAEVNAAFVSLLASCRMHSIEPWAYLRDLFCLLPSWPAKRVLELAPVHWRQTREQQETQQRLAANPFRRAALDLAKHPDSK